MKTVDLDVIGKGLQLNDLGVDNADLIMVNESIRSHPIEVVGKLFENCCIMRII